MALKLTKPQTCIKCGALIPAGQVCQRVSRGRYLCNKCYKKIFITKEVKI